MSGLRFGILDYLGETGVEREVLGDGVEITCFRWRAGEPLPLEVVEQDVLSLWHLGRLTGELLAGLPRLRALVRVGVGYDNVDVVAAGAAGVPVVNVPDYGVDDVADHTWALLLQLARRLPRYERALRRDPREGWDPDRGGHGMRRLRGRRLGIVGFGRIGSAVARRGQSFGMEVCFFDPYLPTGVEKSWQVSRARSLEELIRRSDVVSLHTPSTRRTRGLIDARALGWLPPGALLLNTARGDLVDTRAVHDALRAGTLEGYGADVWPDEPPLVSDPLVSAWRRDEEWLSGRLVLTPHCAFRSDDCTVELRRKAALHVLDLARGVPLRECVNLPHLLNPRCPVHVEEPA